MEEDELMNVWIVSNILVHSVNFGKKNISSNLLFQV